MYAIIRRYCPGSSIDELAQSRQRLGAALSQTPGFVAAITVDENGGAPFTIELFDDKASLVSATEVVEQWSAEQRERPGPAAVAVSTGEVIAQKGL